MEADRIKWNRKYLDKPEDQTPSDAVAAFCPYATIGRALDIACGTGRNSLFLAEKGFIVDAVDISDIGLKKVSGLHPNIRPICADLDGFDIAPNRYNLVVNIRFLNRRLFPLIMEGLLPQGVLIFESYLEISGTVPFGEPGWQPSCRDYLLRENELLHAFLSLRIRYYQETIARKGNEPAFTATLVGIKRG
jgi:SAM-dependent methyltransferase